MLEKQAALERLDHDEELYEEICTLFRTESWDILERLKAAVSTGDAAAATRHAHSLKSVSASIGAVDLSNLAITAEGFGKNGEVDRIALLLPDLAKSIDEAIAEL